MLFQLEEHEKLLLLLLKVLFTILVWIKVIKEVCFSAVLLQHPGVGGRQLRGPHRVRAHRGRLLCLLPPPNCATQSHTEDSLQTESSKGIVPRKLLSPGQFMQRPVLEHLLPVYVSVRNGFLSNSSQMQTLYISL